MADDHDLSELAAALRRVREIYANELLTYRKLKRESSAFGKEVEHPRPASRRSSLTS